MRRLTVLVDSFVFFLFFFFQAEDGIRDGRVTGVQTCALPISGVMTITPWHSQIDLEIAQRHNLDMEQIIDWRGKLLPIAEEFEGMKITRSEERRVGKECRYRWAQDHEKKKIHKKEAEEGTQQQ